MIVTADHGRLPDGRFGGSEALVTTTPLVLWGAGICPGPLGTAQQTDVAPTIAALLGAAPPAQSGGRPLTGALALDAEQTARTLVAWMMQRLDLAELGTPVAAEEARRSAAAALARRDWAASSAGAKSAVAALSPASVPGLLSSVTLWSVAVPLVLFALARVLAWRGRRLARWLQAPLVGAAAYALAWLVIFMGLAGLRYSLSALYENIGGQLGAVALWSGLALAAAGLPLAWLGLDGGAQSVVANLSKLVLVLWIVGGAVSAGIALLVSAPLAAPTAWAVLLIVLAQLSGASLAAPLVALLVAAATDVLARGR